MPPWPQSITLVLIFVIGLALLSGEQPYRRRRYSETVGAVLTLAPPLAFIVLAVMQAAS